jgi:hypothetical protein
MSCLSKPSPRSQWLACMALLLLLIPATGYTQRSRSPEYVFIATPTILPRDIPFNKIIVISQRKDSTGFGYYKRRKILFPEHMTLALKRVIQNAVRDQAQEGNTVLLSVRYLYIGPHTITFAGDFYHKVGDSSLIKLGSLDSLTQLINIHHINYNLGMTYLMANLIRAISDSFALENPANEVTLHRFQVLTRKIHHPRYPILTADTIPACGKYSYLNDFRLNRPHPIAYSVLRNPDSTYGVSSPSRKTRRIMDYGTWGLSDSSGTSYIRIWGDKYVPIERINDTFYVHIPSSIPSMYYICKIQEYDMGTQAVLSGDNFSGYPYSTTGTASQQVAATAILLGVFIVIDVGVIIARNAHRKKLMEEGLADKGYRDFAIDLQTGNIIYNRPVHALPHS